MSIVDTIARTAARLARPPSRAAERLHAERMQRIALGTIARVKAASCRACAHHHATDIVPCLKHTPLSLRAARAKAIGVTR